MGRRALPRARSDPPPRPVADRRRSAHPGTPPQSPRTLVAAALLALVGTLIYSNSLTAPFVLDDHPSIVENPHIRRLWPPGELLHAPTNAITTARPVVSLSLALNYAAGGLDVRGYRLANIALHILTSIVLFATIRWSLRTGRIPARVRGAASLLAFASALLWLTHPMQSQVVNYISQRTESIMALFYLLTVYAAIRAAAAGPGAARHWTAAAIIACAAGMASKQVMVTAPLAVMLWDRVFLPQPYAAVWARRWPLYAGLASTWLIVAGLMWTFRDTNVGSGVSPLDYALSQCVVVAGYLRRAVWPQDLLFDYGLPARTALATAAPYAATLAVAAGASVIALVRWPAAGFAAIWPFLVLAPTSSFIPLATEVGAERRMYLPLAGIVALVTTMTFVLLDRFAAQRAPAVASRRRTPWVTSAALIAAVAAFSYRTLQQNELYRDPVRLWESVLQQRPDHPRALNNLGVALDDAGRRAEAVDAYRRALAASPGFGPASHNLARSLHALGRFDEAIPHYAAALQVRPTAELHVDLAAALESAGRVDEAAREYEQAIALDSSDPRALTGLATALARRGEAKRAVEYYRRALAVDPRYEAAHQNLARALLAAGKAGEAIEQARRAAVDFSAKPWAHRELGDLLLAEGRPREAVEHYRAALRLNERDAATHFGAGVALGLAGEHEQAVQHLDAAVQLAPDWPAALQQLATVLEAQPDSAGRNKARALDLARRASALPQP